MNYLLDTHTLLWWTSEPEKLSQAVRGIISEPTTLIQVSAVSGYEISYKTRCGKLTVPFNSPQEFKILLREEKWTELPLTLDHAVAGGRARSGHRDPFDRLLAAQAIDTGSTLLTIDPAFATFSELKTLW